MLQPRNIPMRHHPAVVFLVCLVLFFTSVASASTGEGEEEAFTGTPNIRIVGWRVDDASGGNGDAGLHPGESAYLWISLSNGGSATARGVMATLSEVIDHPDVTILNKTGSWPDLPATGLPGLTICTDLDLGENS